MNTLYLIAECAELWLYFLYLPNPNSPYIIFPFRSEGGGAVVSVFKGFSCMGRSDTRFSR